MMFLNRSAGRELNKSASKMLKQCKGFVLVTIGKENNRVDVLSDTRTLQHFTEDDPLRVHFTKLSKDLAGGSVRVNVLHKQHLARLEQARKVEEEKERRSLALRGGV